MEIQKLTIDVKNKAGTTTWNNDGHDRAHITIKPEICKVCPHQLCIAGCPTECFKIYDDEMKFQFEDCTECGTCAIMCDQDSVEWHYPRGTYGIQYNQG